jgi:hypothetical protein
MVWHRWIAKLRGAERLAAVHRINDLQVCARHRWRIVALGLARRRQSQYVMLRCAAESSRTCGRRA